MPTERYLVKAVVEEDGKMVQKQWKCSSLNHLTGLHPSFAERSTVEYRQSNGDRHIHIERINWTQDGAKRRKKADRYKKTVASCELQLQTDMCLCAVRLEPCLLHTPTWTASWSASAQQSNAGNDKSVAS